MIVVIFGQDRAYLVLIERACRWASIGRLALLILAWSECTCKKKRAVNPPLKAMFCHPPAKPVDHLYRLTVRPVAGAAPVSRAALCHWH
jgi:hypothetical protein